MATVKAGITITSNSRSHATPGPLSFALSLSNSNDLDVTKVVNEIVDLTDTDALLFDASNFTTTAAEGVDGGFVFLKNLLTSPGVGDNTHDIYIGRDTGNLTGENESKRIMTLKPGEFAFFPWDMTFDLRVDHPETNANALEAMLFVRTTTV
tara:strand:- start:43 stop:498 length:456 start_codon:yes stop_codon:yes gene_type:complete